VLRLVSPSPLVQAYIMVKYKDKGPLDLVAGPGGLDTAWAQVQYEPPLQYTRTWL
jgi:hypothetical protein